MSKISIQGVEIPVEVEDFITPDWKRVMDFYAEWREELGPDAWPMQPYFLAYLKLLVKTGHRGRSEQDWMTRLHEHFGVAHFFEQYQHADVPVAECVKCADCGDAFDPTNLTEVLYHERHKPVPVLETEAGEPIVGKPLLDGSRTTMEDVIPLTPPPNVAEMSATLARLKDTKGVWCEDHQMLDGCGLAILSGAIYIAQQYCETEIAKIEADDRYQAKPADVRVNAPLALEQVNMRATLQALKAVLKKLESGSV